MNMEQFIDLCILCGCDYTCNIQGVGPIKAFNYIKATDGTIEAVIEKINEANEDPKKKQKYVISENFNFAGAREMFKNAEVAKAEELKFDW